jgi:hypothetical protein
VRRVRPAVLNCLEDHESPTVRRPNSLIEPPPHAGAGLLPAGAGARHYSATRSAAVRSVDAPGILADSEKGVLWTASRSRCPAPTVSASCTG